MGLGQGQGLYPGQGRITGQFIEGVSVCIGPCWLGALAMCRRIQCLFDAIPLRAGLHGRRRCRCSRQVVLPCLRSPLPPVWPCHDESGSLQFSVRVGSELSGSQRCWGSGCPPGSCPTQGPGRGGSGRGHRFPWELDRRHHVQHAGMGFPASWGLLLMCSPLLPPGQHPQTPGSYFPFTFTPSSPPASITKEPQRRAWGAAFSQVHQPS